MKDSGTKVITVSIGATSTRSAIGRTPECTLSLADKAHYQAELAGRKSGNFEG